MKAMAELSELLAELGQLLLFFQQLLRAIIHRKQKLGSLIFEQTSKMAFSSMGIVLFTGVFVGAILVIQFRLVLVKYDALIFIGGLSTSAILREIGPLMISFLIAAKVGSYTTAELGTMKITEQVDAMRCLGVDPMEYLVIPRFLAILFGTCLLLFFSLIIGVIGSAFICEFFYGVNVLRFLDSIPRFVGYWTFFGSFAKALVFGLILATVCTYYGYSAREGAKGVGKAVTKSAIFNSFFIVLANSITSFFLENIRLFFERF